MVSVGNILSPEEGAIRLDYLMGAYKHNVSLSLKSEVLEKCAEKVESHQIADLHEHSMCRTWVAGFPSAPIPATQVRHIECSCRSAI
jgi:hypothetical protein